jgi:hypothetical protein
MRTRGVFPSSFTEANGRGDVDYFTSSSTRKQSLALTITSANTLIASSHAYPRRPKTSLLTPNCEYSLFHHCAHPLLTPVLPSVTGALIMDITYGLDVKSHEDKFLQAAKHAMECVEKVMVPGAFLVDTLPIRSSNLPFPSPSVH